MRTEPVVPTIYPLVYNTVAPPSTVRLLHVFPVASIVISCPLRIHTLFILAGAPGASVAPSHVPSVTQTTQLEPSVPQLPVAFEP